MSDEEERGAALDALRARIDGIDRRLIEVISERAEVVTAIGEVKRGTGVPIYAPHRERAVLDKVKGLNPGPLPDRTIEAIYRELMSGSFHLEQPLRVAYLGPPGSFSHLATASHFGASVEHVEQASIDHVCEAVACGRCEHGLVPYENSIGGSISDTLDALQRHDVVVYAERLLGVVHQLLSNSPMASLKEVRSKPQVFAQCREWLARQLPGVPLVATSSTSEAAIMASKEEGVAAIGSALAGRLHGVHALFDGIQDAPDNVTRFLVLGRARAEPSGDDKTTLMFVTRNQPGALVEVLSAFRDRGVNLTHIDKRPSPRASWAYTFFVDCEAHVSEARMVEALEVVEALCVDVKVLGSYPRATMVL